ncbi:MAG: Na+/H+ antiporter subunit E [Blastomonas fulva]|jgi:multicomponent K+:H+ antiporter subunit E|uniref:Na+/H+ antiporter subunit E n=1 Tax=Blastomonas fulva TaxID=1550728 RepID=A0ABM6M6X5_9SPHN|nr:MULTISPECIES: Na+/H+ antiporter subunit E [Blastomonas]ASR51700.1 Na+/H+ antiporter subunit E [Blastomonas fulva]KPF76779.1 cation:proton antiporter [Blastomonas sp. AAP25]MCO5794508.1 Na+/H+ antiporter subunit E [Blastomonas sp.]
MRRLIPHPGLSVLLVIVWLLMANTLTVGGLLLGIVIGILLPIFTAPFWPGRPDVRYRAGLAYIALVLWDIVVANFEIAAIILFRRNRDLRPAWLSIPLDLHTPEAITVLAGTISLTPGTVSSDVSACGKYLLVHALDAADPDAEIARIKLRYEARLKRVFR